MIAYKGCRKVIFATALCRCVEGDGRWRDFVIAWLVHWRSFDYAQDDAARRGGVPCGNEVKAFGMSAVEWLGWWRFFTSFRMTYGGY
jgi:hypothetical protein